MTLKEAWEAGQLESVDGVPMVFANSYRTALQFEDMAPLADRVIERAIEAGRFVEQRHLDPVTEAEVRKRIPPGHKLLAVQVTAVTSAAYLVRPGDRVDIYQLREKAEPLLPGGWPTKCAV